MITIDLKNLRNRTLDATVSVLNKARAPSTVDAIFAKAQTLDNGELMILNANIQALLRDRQNSYKEDQYA